MNFWYYSEIDRFAVTKEKIRPPIQDVICSVNYTELEYFRYIPLEGVTLDTVDRLLSENPREICFEINRVCNLMCPICIAEASSHSDCYLPFSKFEEALRKNKMSVMRITLTGGEPILHADLSKFVRLAIEMIEGIVIATNGFQPEILVNALKGQKTLTVTVSLHGSREIHDKFVGKIGAFDRAANTIKRCLELGHRVEILTTAFKGAIKTLPILSEYLMDVPISEHRVNLVKPKGRLNREAVSWKSVVTAVSQINSKYKLTVKRNDQPFLFIGTNGKEELRHGRNMQYI